MIEFIAKKLNLHVATVQKILDTMEKYGFVTSKKKEGIGRPSKLYCYKGGNFTINIDENDMNVGQYSENILDIDAAIIAKSGRVGREHYDTWCTNNTRNTITINGSLATNQRYGFAWTDGTGYQIRNLIYDNNLTFIPPPHFPTTGEYTFISWKEK